MHSSSLDKTNVLMLTVRKHAPFYCYGHSYNRGRCNEGVVHVNWMIPIRRQALSRFPLPPASVSASHPVLRLLPLCLPIFTCKGKEDVPLGRLA